MNRLLVVILTVSVLLLNCCTSKDPLDVDVSKIEVEMDFFRMDNLLFNSDLTELGKVNRELHDRFGKFYEIYIQYMLKLGFVSDPEIDKRLAEFVSNQDMRQVNEEVNKVFGGFEELEKELLSCFRYFEYYFPSERVPQIVIYHSGFNYGVFPADSIIGIGAEMYLGKDNEILKLLPPQTHPQYLKDKMEPRFIPVDLMEAWVSNKFYSDELFGSNFLSQIVFYGKMRYLIEAMMPSKSDAIVMKYTEDEIKWCKENEFNVWTEIVDKKLLYSTNERDINKFTIDGPFTTGLPKTSPARVGKWVGWQMVRAYMRENSGVGLIKMIQEDPREIIKYYKPNK